MNYPQIAPITPIRKLFETTWEEIGVIGVICGWLSQSAKEKKPIDAQKHLPYDRGNTGKEVILKFMSSYHSEVAAA